MTKFPLSEAVISPCQKYRYALTRSRAPDLFQETEQPINYLWIMLNPSTADHTEDDPTIRRIYDFSTGAKTIRVVNLAAYRAPYPKDLIKRSESELIGDQQQWEQHISDAIKQSDTIICAWGAGVTINDNLITARNVILALLQPIREVYCLDLTKDGHPRHPLYVPSEQDFIIYERPK